MATDFSGGMVRDHPEMNKRVADMTALGRAGLPGGHRPDDCLAALRGEPLDQCPAYRGLGRHVDLDLKVLVFVTSLSDKMPGYTDTG